MIRLLWKVELYILCLLAFGVSAQDPTLGLIINNEESFNGYTLFSPANQFRTYLIDNCGDIVHKWEADSRIGGSEYLLEDGSLLRTARIGGSFGGGGITGRVERYSWEGDLIWSFNYADSDHHLHHDIEPMPNGNILMIAWERKGQQEASQNGKIGLVPQNGLWPDVIIEVQPTGSEGGEIVWEWHAWDHMVQDFDPNFNNYGVIAENPQRFDINYQSNVSDWMHLNAIDYNEALDQIVLSSRHWNEIWIIDHSTTTEEAASSQGGKYGVGGDLLYRWGNPLAYERGTEADQELFGQHDAKWIEDGLRYGNSIMVFNNGTSNSSVDVIMTPLNNFGSYVLEGKEPYGPIDFQYRYDGGVSNPFFSNRISGASMLVNGNILVCEGGNGRFFEINEAEEKVWEYINPDSGNIFSQGEIPTANSTFRVTRYGPNYPAFDGRDLTAQGPIENNPIDSGCGIFSNTTSVDSPLIDIHPTVFDNVLMIEHETNTLIKLRMFDLSGNLVVVYTLRENDEQLDLTHLSQGFYIVHVEKDGQLVKIAKVVKR